MAEQQQNYSLISKIFLKLLALIYFSAFASLTIQITGLVGENGVLPLGRFLTAAKDAFGTSAYHLLPNIFWFNHSDPGLQLLGLTGMFFSCLLFFNKIPKTALVILYCTYLSFYYAGQIFMSYQWDVMLLEVGFLTIFLVMFLGKHEKIIIWLYRFLIFKFMLMSGLVKLFSGDKSWDSLTALKFHFETQPLPTPLAWHAHQLPEIFLIVATGLTLFIELILPFFIFNFRRLRILAGIIFILFQSTIILTGNYNFFNLLSISVCLFLFDDGFIKNIILKIRPDQNFQYATIKKPSSLDNLTLTIFFFILVLLNINTASSSFNITPPGWITSISNVFAPFNIVSQYGPFAVMTKERKEIIIEGSNDKVEWLEYEFKYKPGNPETRPEWIIPHQPRLDWQMWFAALATIKENPWLQNTMYRLLQNEHEVTRLLKHNPFPELPPKYIRAHIYRYEFTNYETRKKNGQWWQRSFLKIYSPPGRLN